MGTYIIEVKTAFGKWFPVETLENVSVSVAIRMKNYYQSLDLFNVYRFRKQEI